MKILYHHRTQAEDGQAVHIRALIRALRGEGHEVREVGLVEHGADRQERTGDKGRSRWGWVTRMPRFARELAEYAYGGVARHRLLKEAVWFEPDVIYERYAFGNTAGVSAARKRRLPLVLEVNSPMVLELTRTRGLSFPGLARKLEDWIFTSADLVCVVTGVLRDLLVEHGVPRERLLVTPNGVHLEAYDYEDRAAARAVALRDLGLPAASERVVGFAGYYRDWHRLDVVLQAMTEAELKDARFVLIGEGPARESLEAEAARLGVADRLHFAGVRPHDDIPRLLTAFDIAVVPAINEYASPLKLHEYMAASLPVIAPDQPNLREVLDPDVHGLLVPPGDTDAMAASLLALGRDEGLRTRLAEAARARVLELDLTWAANARRVVQAAEGLLSRTNAPQDPEASQGAA